MTMRRKKIKAGDYISISLSKTIEPDVISWLNGQENLSKSINVLIRKEVFGSTEGVSGSFLAEEIDKIKLELEKLKNSYDKKDSSEIAIPDSQIVEYPEEEELW
jgi:hypothetical protein